MNWPRRAPPFRSPRRSEIGGGRTLAKGKRLPAGIWAVSTVTRGAPAGNGDEMAGRPDIEMAEHLELLREEVQRRCTGSTYGRQVALTQPWTSTLQPLRTG